MSFNTFKEFSIYKNFNKSPILLHLCANITTPSSGNLTDWPDQSPYAHNITIVGTPTVSNNEVFLPINEGIEIAYSDLSQQLRDTVLNFSLHIYLYHELDHGLAYKKITGAVTDNYSVHFINNIVFYISNSKGIALSSPLTNPYLNSFFVLSIVYNAGIVTFYVNGNLIFTQEEKGYYPTDPPDPTDLKLEFLGTTGTVLIKELLFTKTTDSAERVAQISNEIIARYV